MLPSNISVSDLKKKEFTYTKGFVLLYDSRSTLYNQCLLYY